MTEFTGERVIPGRVDADLWAEHLSRYRFAVNLAKNLGPDLAALDIGCGTGYGTAALADAGASATGIDLAPEAIAYARAHYRHPQLHFIASSATSLPFADASFDLITAFEVIEHLPEGSRLLAEARRVLRPEGVLLVSTPNTTYYAETREQTGPNPFHVHEFDLDEFRAAIAKPFPCCALLVQNHTDAFSFYDSQAARRVEGYIETISGKPSEAHFFLAACSLQPLPALCNFIYVPAATNLLREREHHIRLLDEELRTARAERDTMIQVYAEQNLNVQQLAVHLEEQTKELDSRYRWARQLEDELKQKAGELKMVVDALDAAETTVIERTQWAQRLDAELSACREILHHVQISRWVRAGRMLGVGPQIDAPKTDENV